MEKIKWKYDKKFKEWYAIETTPYANNGFSISKTDFDMYELKIDHVSWKPSFNKLSSAKQVANLLRNG